MKKLIPLFVCLSALGQSNPTQPPLAGLGGGVTGPTLVNVTGNGNGLTNLNLSGNNTIFPSTFLNLVFSNLNLNASNIMYVTTNGNDTTAQSITAGINNPTTPWLTLLAAVNWTKTNGTYSNFFIDVGPGQFPFGSTLVNVNSNTTICGHGSNVTFIDNDWVANGGKVLKLSGTNICIMACSIGQLGSASNASHFGPLSFNLATNVQVGGWQPWQAVQIMGTSDGFYSAAASVVSNVWFINSTVINGWDAVDWKTANGGTLNLVNDTLVINFDTSLLGPGLAVYGIGITSGTANCWNTTFISSGVGGSAIGYHSAYFAQQTGCTFNIYGGSYSLGITGALTNAITISTTNTETNNLFYWNQGTNYSCVGPVNIDGFSWTAP